MTPLNDNKVSNAATVARDLTNLSFWVPHREVRQYHPR
jgi:hypothetical protein